MGICMEGLEKEEDRRVIYQFFTEHEEEDVQTKCRPIRLRLLLLHSKFDLLARSSSSH